MRFKNLDLNLVVLLSSLLATRSVSETGRKLNLSQPAVSAGLGRLRDYFNDSLLVSYGRRMAPTAFAQSLGPMVDRAMTEVEALVSATAEFDPAKSERMFRIGVSDYLCMVAIAPLLRQIHDKAPGIKINTFPPSEAVLQALDAGELDLIINPEEFLSPDYPSELLFEERHVVVGWAENPVFQTGLDEDAYFAAGHVAVALGRERRVAFAERHLNKLRRARNVEVVAHAFAMVPWLLVGTHRLALMHERLANLCARSLPLAIAPLPFEFPRMRQMIQLHPSREADAGVAWLIAALRESLGEEART